MVPVAADKVTFLAVRADWDRTALAIPLPGRFHHLHIDPEPGHPFGRKGRQLAAAWRQLAEPHFAGMLILDGDVAIDRADYAAMTAAIVADPGSVITAPVRIWPVSSGRPAWTWAHWAIAASQDIEPAPLWFSFCFTYLPRKLITACARAGLASWAYPTCDQRVSQCAQSARIPAKIAANCWPKHLHY